PYLLDHDGSLIILISSLAEHTKNILHDPRVSLITHDQRDAHIQTQGRITLLGNAALIDAKDTIGTRYLRYFPEAESYFAMHDFAFYRIQPIAIRYIGGFGKIHWVNIEQYTPAPYALINQEADVVAHMNADHADTMRSYCKQFHQREVLDVAMLGIDCDGFDMRADGEVLRIDFAEAVADAQQARSALVGLAHRK
ncbi:MAG: HugZ family pyridoxamine 5'-phosphate oxidase, partial [Gallionella sp.]